MSVVKESESAILDLVADAAERILISEALVLKRLGIDDVPIPTNDKQTDYSEREEDEKLLQFLIQRDDGREVQEFVRDFATATTCATVALHKEIENVSQNRPFGGSTAVERLMIENLNLLEEIREYDDRTSREYYSDEFFMKT